MKNRKTKSIKRNRRQNIEICKSSETRVAEVSRRSEPSSRGNRTFEVRGGKNNTRLGDDQPHNGTILKIAPPFSATRRRAEPRGTACSAEFFCGAVWGGGAVLKAPQKFSICPSIRSKFSVRPSVHPFENFLSVRPFVRQSVRRRTAT